MSERHTIIKIKIKNETNQHDNPRTKPEENK